MSSIPTDITDIASMSDADAVLRNLRITQRYHDLSQCLSDVVGTANVNWSTFAAWASKTAGQSIRNEEVPAFVRPIVEAAYAEARPHLGLIGRAIGAIVSTTGFHPSFLLSPITATLKDVSRSISRGNLKVFAELAPEFVRFARTFRGVDRDRQKLDDYLSQFKPGATADGGQDTLKAAFSAYWNAAYETDATARARFMLLANCLVGVHEQTRLQPEIKEALDAPIRTVLHAHLRESLRTSLPGHLIDGLSVVIAEPMQALESLLDVIWERVATRHLMALALPGGGALPLGRDIPVSAAARDFIPAQLQNITAPPELVALIVEYDRAQGDSDLGSASVDWAVLADRMNFIVNLFRSRQQDQSLFGEPFTADQRERIEHGMIPAGPL